MPLLDDRGNLFGRINLIDAAMVFVLLWCIPLGYGAFRVFRVPTPEIHGIQPATVVAGPDVRLTIEGRNFRPYLRATVGPTEAQFLLESTTRAEVHVAAELAPGTYDLVLLDIAEEVARQPNGVVVEAPVVKAPPLVPTHELEVWGAFVGLDADRAKTLSGTRQVGDKGGTGSAEVLSLESPERELVHLTGLPPAGSSTEDSFEVNAHLRLRCALVGTECHVAGTTVAPGAVFPLAPDNEKGVLRFHVSGIFPPSTEMTAGATTLEVVVRGAFLGLDRARADRLSGAALSEDSSSGSWNRILAVAPPESEIVELPQGAAQISGATGRFRVDGLAVLRCAVLGDGCNVGSVTLEPGALLAIPTAAGVLSFRVSELYPAGTTLVDVTMRSAGDLDLLSLVSADVASYRANSPSGVEAWEPALVAVLDVEEDANLTTNLGGFGFEQPGALFSVVIRLRARQAATGWHYGTAPLRSGERFEYSQSSYSLTGVIAGVAAAPQQAESLTR
jgi:hypothetical protein